MKNRLPNFISTALVFLPLFLFVLYQFFKNIHTDKFLLSLLALIATIGSYFLVLLSFSLKKEKVQ